MKSRSIPLVWYQAGQCQHILCPGLARGYGVLLSWKRCSAPGCETASLGSGASGHPSAPNRVLDPLMYRFSQITPLVANRISCCVKLLISIFAGLSCRFRSQRRSGTILPCAALIHQSKKKVLIQMGMFLVMAISLSRTSTTRSKTSSERQSFPNEHISLLGIENTHPSVPRSQIPV